jgi:chloramphenicol 3-O-phosphotransferase
VSANPEGVSIVTPGRIVVLNGPPRSGKSSIADVIQETWAPARAPARADAPPFEKTPAT